MKRIERYIGGPYDGREDETSGGYIPMEFHVIPVTRFPNPTSYAGYRMVKCDEKEVVYQFVVAMSREKLESNWHGLAGD